MMGMIREIINYERGFTLVELIVVIAVLGILAGITVPRLSGVQDKAHYAAGKALLANLKTPLELYRVENGNYPDDVSSYDDLNAAIGEDNGYIDNFENLLPESSEEDWFYSSYTYDSDNNNYTLVIEHPRVDDNMKLTPDGGITRE